MATERIEAPVTFKAYLMCTFAAFGGILFGYDTGWMNGVLAVPYFISMYTGIPYDYEAGRPIGVSVDQFAIPSSQSSLMTSILSCGTFVGALIAGDLADMIGRRMTIVVGCAITSLGCVLQIVSTNQLALMIAGRLVAGLGIGFISAIIVLYMSEIAPKKVRGALVSSYQLCITIGILIASCAVYASQNLSSSASYRIPVGIQFIWSLVLGVGLIYLPESPRYFVKKCKLEEAAVALSSLRGQPVDSTYIKDEMAEIIACHEFELENVPSTSYIGSWTACLKGSIFQGNSNLRRTVLGLGLMAMQQLSGINFIFYFGTSFFMQLKTISNPFLMSLITTLVNVFSTPISLFTMDRLGRRFLLIWGAIGMVVSQLLVAILGTALPHSTAVVGSMIALICINIFFFAFTWGPAPWVIVGECFPLQLRSRGVGLSTAANWFFNCVVSLITPYMVGKEPGSADLGAKVFFVWGACCAAAVAFTYFLVPEMRGLSLEQADRMLGEVSPRKSAAWVDTAAFTSSASANNPATSAGAADFHSGNLTDDEKSLA